MKKLTKHDKKQVDGQLGLGTLQKGTVPIVDIKQRKQALRTINSKGRVCIPTDIRDMLDIADGDGVIVSHAVINGLDYALVRKIAFN